MRTHLVFIGLLAVSGGLAAQSLDRRVATAPDGEVRLTFTSREGVRGDGAGSISWSCDDDDCHHTMSRGRGRRGICEEGPVRVRLIVAGGKITDLDTYVGGDWRSTSARVTAIDDVPAAAAATWLLQLARRERTRVGKEAILPALLADSFTAWPALLDIAKDKGVLESTRKSAVFWVGQAAEEAATKGLADLVDADDGEREVQESAVFALSQRPRDEGVPVLLRVARTHKDPEIRKKAIFWLGQSGDPRALAYFEEVLTRP